MCWRKAKYVQIINILRFHDCLACLPHICTFLILSYAKATIKQESQLYIHTLLYLYEGNNCVKHYSSYVLLLLLLILLVLHLSTNIREVSYN